MQIWKLLSLRDSGQNCIKKLKTLTLPKLHGVKRVLDALLAIQLDPWCCVRLGTGNFGTDQRLGNTILRDYSVFSY